MGSIAKNIRYSLFVFCIFISMPMLGKQLGDNLLDVLELSENKDTLLKYNGNYQVLDLSIFHELSDIKVIGREAFAYNLTITEIFLPHSIHTIGNGAFEDCIYNHRTTKTNQKYPSVNL